MLACRVEDQADDRWCRRCGCEGRSRDTVIRRLAHEPLGWRPTTLLVTIRRYRCTGCGHVWRQDTSRAAEPRAKLSRTALRWALVGLVCQHLTVARLAEALAVSIADDDADAAARAAASVKVALEDHGLSAERATVDVDCAAPCVTPGREVAVSIRVRVPLPGVTSIGLDSMVVPVEASHRGVVDRLRATP